MNTQLLWARIEVSLHTHFDKEIAYLHRSKTAPSDLYIDINTNFDFGWASHVDPDVHLYAVSEWETIMSYMTRRRLLSARCNEPDVIDDMINKLHMVNVPLLQYLQIECPYREVEPHMAPYRNIIDGGAPSMTAVRLEVGIAPMFTTSHWCDL
jgi:hypothetical protein